MAGTECDAAYDKLKANQENSSKAKRVLAGAGYARGGGVSPVRANRTADKEIDGKKPTKLKAGGKVDGKKPMARPDRMARGGSKPRGHTKININVGAGQQEKQNALRTGVALGAQLAAHKLAGGARPMAGAPMQARPPMPPPPGAGPGGMPPGGPPMPQKRGGRTYAKGGKVGPVRVAGVPHMDAGSGGGAGRREKMRSYGTKPKK